MINLIARPVNPRLALLPACFARGTYDTRLRACRQDLRSGCRSTTDLAPSTMFKPPRHGAAGA
jgi:hypothetical protein